VVQARLDEAREGGLVFGLVCGGGLSVSIAAVAGGEHILRVERASWPAVRDGMALLACDLRICVPSCQFLFIVMMSCGFLPQPSVILHGMAAVIGRR